MEEPIPLPAGARGRVPPPYPPTAVGLMDRPDPYPHLPPLRFPRAGFCERLARFIRSLWHRRTGG